MQKKYSIDDFYNFSQVIKYHSFVQEITCFNTSCLLLEINTLKVFTYTLQTSWTGKIKLSLIFSKSLKIFSQANLHLSYGKHACLSYRPYCMDTFTSIHRFLFYEPQWYSRFWVNGFKLQQVPRKCIPVNHGTEHSLKTKLNHHS